MSRSGLEPEGYPGDALIDAANDSLDLRAENDRLRAALQHITEIPCGIPGHAVAVGCRRGQVAWKALNAPDEKECPDCKGAGWSGAVIRDEDGNGRWTTWKCSTCGGTGWVGVREVTDGE